jgi:hypothetical protein
MLLELIKNKIRIQFGRFLSIATRVIRVLKLPFSNRQDPPAGGTRERIKSIIRTDTYVGLVMLRSRTFDVTQERWAD